MTTDVEEFGLRASSLTTADFPDDWLIVQDKESKTPVFMAFPPWLFEKLKNGHFISEADLSRYKSEVGDLIIDFHIKNK